jgi:phosphohistidine phosphatase SixA
MKTALLLLVCGALSALSQPAQIILLRHAEKPDDDSALRLSARGEKRARALADFLGQPNALTSNAPIAALYATRVTRHAHSQRTGQTLAPLAKQLSLPVLTPYDAELYTLLARDILNNRAYQGKTVVICWTHHDMAELAEALGVLPKPTKWKDNTFDRLWLIHPGSRGAGFNDLPQRLLKGDSKH